MGAFWKDRSNTDLTLHYNGILWGLREECHCQVRRFDGKCYVIPQVCTVAYFAAEIKPGMEGAKKEIERILKERGVVKIKRIRLHLMTEEEMMIRTLGWEAYKNVKRAGLEFSGRGTA